jgi:hypothetical protein
MGRTGLAGRPGEGSARAGTGQAPGATGRVALMHHIREALRVFLRAGPKLGRQDGRPTVLASGAVHPREEARMTKARRILVSAMIPAVVLVAASTATVMGRPQDKVDVCHVTGNGSFHEINISKNALPAHLRHGDAMPDEYGDCP